MSVHFIYRGNGGAKFMRPIHTREEYLSLRNGGEQRQLVERIRKGEEGLKHKLVQMNYSCLPNEDGSLKGSKAMSTTVGMDIDFVAPKDLSDEEKQAWLSERMAGVPELTQEENLKWASDLLGVKFDDSAKDITRVFFTTSADQLLYLDDTLFEIEKTNGDLLTTTETTKTTFNGDKMSPQAEVLPEKLSQLSMLSSKQKELSFPSDYHGIPFKDIIAKYWELFNGGKEPVEGDRNALTFELAVTIRSICGYSLEKLMQVVPNYWKALRV